MTSMTVYGKPSYIVRPTTVVYTHRIASMANLQLDLDIAIRATARPQLYTILLLYPRCPSCCLLVIYRLLVQIIMA